MKRKKNFIFTNRKHTKKGMMSAILGVISVTSISSAIYITFQQRGVANFNFGIAVLFAGILAIAGITLGIMARIEKDNYYIFPNIGILLNFISVVSVGLLLYAGVTRL